MCSKVFLSKCFFIISLVRPPIFNHLFLCFWGCLEDFFLDVRGVSGSVFVVFWKVLGVKRRGKPGKRKQLNKEYSVFHFLVSY